jgi:hypothetical protein
VHARTNRFGKSFVAQAIRILNKWLMCRLSCIYALNCDYQHYETWKCPYIFMTIYYVLLTLWLWTVMHLFHLCFIVWNEFPKGQ